MKRMFIVLCLLVVAVGCVHERELVTLPPEAPMADVRHVIVVGFGNFTVDPGLADLAEDIIAERLAGSGRYEIVDGAAARAALARLDITSEQLASPQAAQALGAELGIDAIITGEVTYYFEDTHVTIPRCYGCDTEKGSPWWSVDHRTTISVQMRARVIRTSNGAIIWSRSVEGQDRMIRPVTVSRGSKHEPPPSLVPAPDRQDVPRTRHAAVEKATAEFTKDLLPRDVWVRTE